MNILILHINFFNLSSFFFLLISWKIIFFHGPIKVSWMFGTVPPVSPTAQNESGTNQLSELAI